NAALLDGVEARLAVLVVAVDLPAAEEAIARDVRLEADRAGARRAVVLGYGVAGEVGAVSDAAGGEGADVVRHHHLAHGIGQECVVAVDRDACIALASRGSRAEEAAEIVSGERLLAVDALGVDVEVVGDIEIEIREAVRILRGGDE